MSTGAPHSRAGAYPPSGSFGRSLPSRRAAMWGLIASSATLVVVIAASALLGFFTSMASAKAAADKAQLDQTLTHAQTTVAAPPRLLSPISASEQQVAASIDGTAGSYQHADTMYVQLRQQALGIEQMPPAQARALAQSDLTNLEKGVKTISDGNFVEAQGFESRLSQAQNQFAKASTTHDYFTLDAYITDQLTAVNLFKPTYDSLQAFTKLVNDEQGLINGGSSGGSAPLQCAIGLNEQFWMDDPIISASTGSGQTLPETQWAQSDLQAFRSATTGKQFQDLNSLIASQTQQAQANEATALPGVTTSVLQTFQNYISTTKKQQVDTSAAEKLYAQDQQQAQALASHPSNSGYTTLITTIRKHAATLELPVLKAQTNADLATLKQLVAQGQASKTVDPANGIGYPNAYEYADPNTGIGDAEQRLPYAQTVADYQAVDDEMQMFIHNIQAMLTNLNDKTPSTQVHQTDLQLLSYYQVTPDRVIVVSLREQEARLYDNGKLVKSFPVTTGAPDLPSVPGIHCVLDKLTHTLFKSPDPPGSPNYYAPTPINFAMDYSYYGYALHDAWWRSWFGKYSNLPHYDPSAFNGGSHGCINFALSDIPYVFDWASVGTPIIVY